MSLVEQVGGETPPIEHDVVRRIVELACRAPSVHNTQPWRWRIDGLTLELRADRDRQLPVADPTGRNLVISCGTALHHARVAARAEGFATSVRRLPDPRDSDVLAVIELGDGHPTPDTLADLRALEQRCTDRRRFTSWPVPDERLEHLAEVTASDFARVRPLTGVVSRFRTELLVNRAMTEQEADLRFTAEQQLWVDRSSVDGVPAGVIPPADHYPGSRRNRFAHGLYPDARQELVEASDGLLAVTTDDDGALSWLRAGEMLSMLWLEATKGGLSVVPLSQVVEIEETRAELFRTVFAGLEVPQILVRIGWQQIGRSSLPRTPRRPLDEVLAR
ncbi:hypothetical protein [Nocardioides sp.]|uniref:Acg family FMN-binding oxidoreductase n=1 Tax=Nocardioides sp. TaxID=35761 RepID=UPI0031FF3EEB|nr:hypothetical protein [Nocardioides sp.]